MAHVSTSIAPIPSLSVLPAQANIILDVCNEVRSHFSASSVIIAKPVATGTVDN